MSKKFFLTSILSLFAVASIFASDISVTAANVSPSANAQLQRITAGVAITAGQTIYKFTDGTAKLADANGSGTTTLLGIACNTAGVGQPVMYVANDTLFNPGATVTAGTVYVLSATAGGICPAADLATGHVVNIVGIGAASNKLWVHVAASGQTVP